MPIPPEVAFDRYFRGLNPAQQKIYEGKFDIEQLAVGPLKELLLMLQSALNLALANERYVPEHRDHPPFHVDYIRSAEMNALAFRHEGFSFIGLTIPLIKEVAQLCGRLCNSTDLLSALDLRLTQEVSEEIGALLLKILIFFVVSHEYTHIVHGHPLSEPRIRSQLTKFYWRIELEVSMSKPWKLMQTHMPSITSWKTGSEE